jgi:3-hydroxyacyl-CoA dehydrogenase
MTDYFSFIFNRLWAAIKRESLKIIAQGVSDPKEIDALWVCAFASPSRDLAMT